jgi:hypothetical protein
MRRPDCSGPGCTIKSFTAIVIRHPRRPHALSLLDQPALREPARSLLLLAKLSPDVSEFGGHGDRPILVGACRPDASESPWMRHRGADTFQR